MTLLIENLIIREATLQDANQLLQLLRELYSLETDFEFHENTQREGLYLLMNSPDQRTIWIAQYQEKLVGMCAVQVFPSTAEGGLVMLFEDFVVTQSKRNQGIGHKLFEAAQKWGEKRDVKRFQLLSNRLNNQAIEFYQKQGWQKTDLIYFFKKTVTLRKEMKS